MKCIQPGIFIQEVRYIKTYRTAQVAEIIGVHPNTVRLYEKWELIPEAMREENGYRVFTEFHIAVFRLARTAFEIEVLQSGLRKKMTQTIKAVAKKEFDSAITFIEEYQLQVKKEQKNAQESIQEVEQIIFGNNDSHSLYRTRSETAKYLEISSDTLRNWERNTLLHVKRSENGYRIYTEEDIKRLKIIRTLRCANYSLASIFRLLNQLPDSNEENDDIKQILNTPKPNEDIVSVCDHLLISLEKARKNANIIKNIILDLKTKY